MFDIDWLRLGTWMLITTTGGLAVFHLIAGYYHIRYYVLKKERPEDWKCQADRQLSRKLQIRAAKSSSANMVLGSILTAIMIYAVEEGFPCPVYFDVADYGWTYTIFSTVLLFVILDAMAFYLHWLMHFPFFYKRFHKQHHTYVATTPYATTAVHPVFMVMLQVGTAIPIFLIPFHIYSIIFVLVYILIFNIIDHSGVDLDSIWPWQASSRYHDDHHKYFHVNFGQHLMIWDKLHGTLRREGQTYGPAVFGGKGKAEQDDAEMGPYVQY